MPDNHVYVVIAVHNRRDVTLECLGYLEEQTFDEFTVVVVDDGSTDGTTEAIREQYPDTVLLRGTGDMFWGGATAKGVEYVLERADRSDYVLTLNDDLKVEPDYLETIHRVAENNPGALVGSACRNYYDEDELFYSRITLDWKRYDFGHRAVDPAGTEHEAVDVLPGRGTMIPVEVVHDVGNFDGEVFPQYLCDYDFALRARQAGYRLLMAHDAVVYDRRDMGGNIARDRDELGYREALDLLTDRTPINLRAHVRFVVRHCPLNVWPDALRSMADHVLSYTFYKTPGVEQLIE